MPVIRYDQGPWGSCPGVRIGRVAPTDEEETPVAVLTGLTSVGNPQRLVHPKAIRKILQHLFHPISVLMVTSADEKCGIAQYTQTLADNMPNWCKVSVVSWGDYLFGDTLPAYDLVHFQYEPSLVENYDRFIQRVKGERTPVLTAHFYDDGLRRIRRYFGLVIVHDKRFVLFKNHFYLVQGCPVFKKKRPSVLRHKLGIVPWSKVICSFGFLMEWKKIPEVVQAIAPHIAMDSRLFLVLLHSIYPRAEGYGKVATKQILTTIEQHQIQDRVLFRYDFISKGAINDYMQASDIGFLYADDVISAGSSASSKEFVAGRCPLVASAISHYSDLTQGVSFVPAGDVHALIYRVLDLLNTPEYLSQLKKEQCKNYDTLNYRRISLQHAHLYREVAYAS